MEVEEDARAEVGSPEMGATEEDSHNARSISDVRLPPVRSFMPPAAFPPSGAAAQQTRRAMRSSAVSQDVLLGGPTGVTAAPADFARNNACDKLPPIPSMIPPRRATFFSIQNLPVADGSGLCATMCAPDQRPMPAPRVSSRRNHTANCQPHWLIAPPRSSGDGMNEWKETQRAANAWTLSRKVGELTVAERLE